MCAQLYGLDAHVASIDDHSAASAYVRVVLFYDSLACANTTYMMYMVGPLEHY